MYFKPNNHGEKMQLKGKCHRILGYLCTYCFARSRGKWKGICPTSTQFPTLTVKKNEGKIKKHIRGLDPDDIPYEIKGNVSAAVFKVLLNNDNTMREAELKCINF